MHQQEIVSCVSFEASSSDSCLLFFSSWQTNDEDTSSDFSFTIKKSTGRLHWRQDWNHLWIIDQTEGIGSRRMSYLMSCRVIVLDTKNFLCQWRVLSVDVQSYRQSMIMYTTIYTLNWRENHKMKKVCWMTPKNTDRSEEDKRNTEEIRGESFEENSSFSPSSSFDTKLVEYETCALFCLETNFMRRQDLVITRQTVSSGCPSLFHEKAFSLFPVIHLRNKSVNFTKIQLLSFQENVFCWYQLFICWPKTLLFAADSCFKLINPVCLWFWWCFVWFVFFSEIQEQTMMRRETRIRGCSRQSLREGGKQEWKWRCLGRSWVEIHV